MKDETSATFGDLSRRELMRLGGVSAIGLGLAAPKAEAAKSTAATMIGVPFAAANPRIGIIGTGGRGTSLLQNLLAADARVPALCDIVREKAEHAQALVV